jgi:hypothetical protein
VYRGILDDKTGLIPSPRLEPIVELAELLGRRRSCSLYLARLRGPDHGRRGRLPAYSATLFGRWDG